MLRLEHALAILLAFAIACASGPKPAPGASGAPSGTLTMDVGDPLANPPQLDGDASRVRDLQTGLDLAREKLKTLDRYHTWQSQQEHYDTHISIDGSHVHVLFAPPLVTDQEISIDVDLTTKTTQVALGAA